MLQFSKWKTFLIILACVLGIAYALPNLFEGENTGNSGWMPHKKVNLGLDLRGGSHLLLQVDSDAVVKERIESLIDAVRSELRKENIGYIGMASTANGYTLTLRDIEKDRDAAYKSLRNLSEGMVVDIASDGKVSATYDEAGLANIRSQVINQSIEIVRRRIDESGTREPLIQRQGDNRIVVQLPGVDDPEHVKELLGKTAKMAFHLTDETSMTAGPTSMRLPLREAPGQHIIVKKRVMVSGDMLTDSQPSFDETNSPIVSFNFDSVGARRFCDVTRDNIGKPFAIVLDNEVISAPTIRSEICGGRGMIQGGFTVKEANDLALLLRAGALPAPLAIVEERTVGPTLGSDSVAAGKKACIMALVFVAAMACLVYGLFGIFAAIALLINMIMLIAILSVLQATLTLPGIAGIVLTIGLAIDANVLVYERVKEELREGRSILSAIDIGYQRALTTVTDSNVAALIAAMILFSFGTGPIKGFAVTMCIGVATSYFCAMMLTRLMVVSWVRWKKPKKVEA